MVRVNRCLPLHNSLCATRTMLYAVLLHLCQALKSTLTTVYGACYWMQRVCLETSFFTIFSDSCTFTWLFHAILFSVSISTPFKMGHYNGWFDNRFVLHDIHCLLKDAIIAKEHECTNFYHVIIMCRYHKIIRYLTQTLNNVNAIDLHKRC